MKRIYLLMLLLFVVNSVYSQKNEWYWDESTKEKSHEAPTSKFAKKWYSKNEDGYYDVLTINPNGTYTQSTTIVNNEIGYPILIKFSFNGTWKRNNKQVFQMTTKNFNYSIDKTILTKIPVQRRNVFTRAIENKASEIKKLLINTIEYYNILRIDDDHLIFTNADEYCYYASERLTKKIEKEEVEEAKKAEEIRKAEEIETDVFTSVEEMPQFPGGPSAMFEYLSINIQYPEAAKMNGIQGRVIVTFIVEKDGSVSNAKVAKSLEPSLDKEALRLVEAMPHWTPGKQNGELARVKFTVPVTFRL